MANEAADANVTLVDYTDAFDVERTIRKLGRVYIPIREGLRVSDIKMFGIAAGVWLVSWSVVINPVLRALIRPFGWSTPTGLPYLAILLVPPIVVALAARTPVKHNLRMLAAMRLWALDMLDDPIHYRGQPVKAETSSNTHYLDLFEADPEVLPAQGLTAEPSNGWGGLVRPGERLSQAPDAPRPEEPEFTKAETMGLINLHTDPVADHAEPHSDGDVLVIRARRD